MNRNIFLATVGITAIAISLLLFLFNPEEKASSSSFPKNTSSSLADSITSDSDIDIKVRKIQHSQQVSSISSQQISKKNPSKTEKKRTKTNPYIKARAVDHSRKYLIELIDTSPDNKDVTPVYNPGEYYQVSGKINGSFYLLKVPKNIVITDKTKIKIIDLKSKETIKETGADVLSEIIGNEGTTTQLNINTRDKEGNMFDVKFKEYYSGENPSIPHI
jgi:hypothetical protein